MHDDLYWKKVYKSNWKRNIYINEKYSNWFDKVVEMVRVNNNWKYKKYNEIIIDPTIIGDVALVGGFNEKEGTFIILHNNDYISEWEYKTGKLLYYQSFSPSARTITYIIQKRNPIEYKKNEPKQIICGDKCGYITIWSKMRKSWRCIKRIKVFSLFKPIRLSAEWNNNGMNYSKICCYSMYQEEICVYNIENDIKLFSIRCRSIQDVIHDKDYIIVGSTTGFLGNFNNI